MQDRAEDDHAQIAQLRCAGNRRHPGMWSRHLRSQFGCGPLFPNGRYDQKLWSGVNLKWRTVRLEDERLAALVVIGARSDGTKEVVALEDGYRESTESWLALLRDLKERGMRAPVVAVGDGALGFWAAIREVFPETREERCWVHKIANVLDKLPKSLQPKAKAALHEMMNAPTKAECEKLVTAFVANHEAKYPKAAKALATESNKLMTHFELPAEHWKHLRTTNPIESTFATVKLR